MTFTAAALVACSSELTVVFACSTIESLFVSLPLLLHRVHAFASRASTHTAVQSARRSAFPLFPPPSCHPSSYHPRASVHTAATRLEIPQYAPDFLRFCEPETRRVHSCHPGGVPRLGDAGGGRETGDGRVVREAGGRKEWVGGD